MGRSSAERPPARGRFTATAIRVQLAAVLAGYDSARTPKNADAQIGAITVGGDWLYSGFIAGVQNSASGHQSFGNANDERIGGAGTTDLAGILSKIASVTIGGQIVGLADGQAGGWSG